MHIVLRILAISSLLLALVVVSYGAYVRLNDAGLDCPDWPGCYGQITPPDTPAEIEAVAAEFERPVDTAGGWKEMIHRYVASGLGLLIIIMAVLSVVMRLQGARTFAVGLPIMLVVLVLIQGALGYLTVSEGVHPLIVTSHLGLGMFLVGLLCWFALRTFAYSPQQSLQHVVPRDVTLRLGSDTSKGMRGFAVFALFLLMLQIILGGWTSTNYAAAYCTDFPGCRVDAAIPAMDFKEGFWITPPAMPARGDWEGGAMSGEARQAIHMTHRAMALLVTVIILFLIVWVRFTGLANRRQKAISLLVLAALTGQVSLGILTALQAKAGMPVMLATLHNTGAAILLCSLIWLTYKLHRSSLSRHRVELFAQPVSSGPHADGLYEGYEQDAPSNTPPPIDAGDDISVASRQPTKPSHSASHSASLRSSQNSSLVFGKTREGDQ